MLHAQVSISGVACTNTLDLLYAPVHCSYIMMLDKLLRCKESVSIRHCDL
jgi:hypothetical protein